MSLDCSGSGNFCIWFLLKKIYKNDVFFAGVCAAEAYDLQARASLKHHNALFIKGCPDI